MARFAQFLDFLRRNLNGQTTLAVHPGWASQSEILAGFARFGSPDLVLREASLTDDLEFLGRQVGATAGIAFKSAQMPDFLQDKDLHRAARNAYLRDYVAFGFE